MEKLREKINREMRSGLYTLFILQSLHELKESYGYEIVKHLDRKSGGEVRLKDATVYPVLRYLTKKKILESYWTEPDKGMPRKYYRLTPLGERLLQELKKDFRTLKDVAEKILEGDGE